MAIVTISRGSFVGGRKVAEKLAESLGYPILGREEVLADVARDYGVSEKELSKTMNGAPPFWLQVPTKRLAYVKCVTSVVLAHAVEGNLVYHGIAGHLILSDIPQVLRVRVIADMQYRIKARMEESNLNRDQAVAFIQRVDKERSRWARLLYGVEWEDPSLYDMIINLGKVSSQSASATVARLVEQKEFETTTESRTLLDNFTLSSRVWANLAQNPATRSAAIQVDANAGEVVVSGTVTSVKAMEQIPQIAEVVEGVRSLRCEVGVGTDWYW